MFIKKYIQRKDIGSEYFEGIYSSILQDMKQVLFDDTPQISNKIQHSEHSEEVIENTNTLQNSTEFELLMKVILWKPSTKWKRIQTIINDFNLEKSKSTTRKIREYFIKQNIKIVLDDRNGHKIYIEY